MTIVRAVTQLAVVSLCAAGFAACTAQVDAPRLADEGAEPIDHVAQAVQLPNCDHGVGTFSGSKPIPGVGQNSSGDPTSCNIGTFFMSWQCVRFSTGAVAPQNVLTSTNFCYVLSCEPRGDACHSVIGCC